MTEAQLEYEALAKLVDKAHANENRLVAEHEALKAAAQLAVLIYRSTREQSFAMSEAIDTLERLVGEEMS